MDLTAELLALAFELLLATITILLAVTYYSFFKMNAQIRRARMFIMSDRIQRFLLAFLMGFLSLVVTFIGSFAGLVIPPVISAVVVFFFLGAVSYGSLELFLIAKPNPSGRFRSRKQKAKGESTSGGFDEREVSL